MLERISLRGIARVTGVSWSWLQNYVNNKLAAVPRQIKVSDKPKGKLVIECDEMWSFVFSKTIKVYIWLAIDIGLGRPGVYRQCAVAYTDFWESY